MYSTVDCNTGNMGADWVELEACFLAWLLINIDQVGSATQKGWISGCRLLHWLKGSDFSPWGTGRMQNSVRCDNRCGSSRGGRTPAGEAGRGRPQVPSVMQPSPAQIHAKFDNKEVGIEHASDVDNKK